MKKLVFALFAVFILTNCSSNNTTKSETDTKSAPVTPGIENVNGNVPDTTTTIRLNRPLPIDSASGTDSARQTNSMRH